MSVINLSQLRRRDEYVSSNPSVIADQWISKYGHDFIAHAVDPKNAQHVLKDKKLASAEQILRERKITPRYEKGHTVGRGYSSLARLSQEEISSLDACFDQDYPDRYTPYGQLSPGYSIKVRNDPSTNEKWFEVELISIKAKNAFFEKVKEMAEKHHTIPPSVVVAYDLARPDERRFDVMAGKIYQDFTAYPITNEEFKQKLDETKAELNCELDYICNDLWRVNHSLKKELDSQKSNELSKEKENLIARKKNYHSFLSARMKKKFNLDPWPAESNLVEKLSILRQQFFQQYAIDFAKLNCHIRASKNVIFWHYGDLIILFGRAAESIIDRISSEQSGEIVLLSPWQNNGMFLDIELDREEVLILAPREIIDQFQSEYPQSDQYTNLVAIEDLSTSQSEFFKVPLFD